MATDAARRRWKKNQLDAGRCVTCGKPRNGSPVYCPLHHARNLDRKGSTHDR